MCFQVEDKLVFCFKWSSKPSPPVAMKWAGPNGPLTQHTSQTDPQRTNALRIVQYVSKNTTLGLLALFLGFLAYFFYVPFFPNERRGGGGGVNEKEKRCLFHRHLHVINIYAL